MFEDKGIVIPVPLEQIKDSFNSEDIDNETLVDFVLSLGNDDEYEYLLLKTLSERFVEANQDEKDTELYQILDKLKGLLE